MSNQDLGTKFRLVITQNEHHRRAVAFYDAEDSEYADSPVDDLIIPGWEVIFDGIVMMGKVDKWGELTEIAEFPTTETLKQ